MMKKILISFLLSVLATCVFAQNVPFDKSAFPNNKKGVKDAIANIKDGDKYLASGEYREAYTFYLKAQEFNPNNAELNFKLFRCTYSLKMEEQSYKYLNRAYELDPNVDPDVAYYKGMEQQSKYNYKEAINFYRQVPQSSRWYKDAEKKIHDCNFSIIAMKGSPVRVFVDNVGPSINTEYDEYNPVITADGRMVYFTSRRKYKGAEYSDDGNYFENIFFSRHRGDEQWSQSEMVEGINNHKDHDAVQGITVDGHKMLIYRANNGGDLYETVKKGGKWEKPKALKVLNSKWHETSASYAYDGKTIYFCSDREGGYGEHDIYRSVMNAKGEWSKPENLGDVVNTAYDEKSVFAHPDGKTLYFCSDGHPGFGGYDIFVTSYENGQWTQPINLGYPVNTSDNDAYFVVTADKRTGYYSSKQAGGNGGYDIYKLSFLGPEKEFAYRVDNDLITGAESYVDVDIKREQVAIEEARLTLLRGIVVDASTKMPIVGASIDLYDIAQNKQLLSFETDDEGRFLLSLPAGHNYGENVNAPGYLFHSENFNIPEDAKYVVVEQTIELDKIAVGKSIVLNNIFFDFDKTTLKPESITELDKVYDLMVQNPTIVVELSGHTDNKGSAAYNKDLSMRRAQVVVDYLMRKGIPKKRLKAAGYGFDRPIDTNDTEEGRARNRRTEFTIIGN